MKPLKERYEHEAWQIINDYLAALKSEMLSAGIKQQEAKKLTNDIAAYIYYKADDYFEIKGIITIQNINEVLDELGSPTEIVTQYQADPTTLQQFSENPNNYYYKQVFSKVTPSSTSKVDNPEQPTPKVQPVTPEKPIPTLIGMPALAVKGILFSIALITVLFGQLTAINYGYKILYTEKTIFLLNLIILLIILDLFISSSFINRPLHISTSFKILRWKFSLKKLNTFNSLFQPKTIIRFYYVIGSMFVLSVLKPISPVESFLTWILHHDSLYRYQNIIHENATILDVSHLLTKITFSLIPILLIVAMILIVEKIFEQPAENSWVNQLFKQNDYQSVFEFIKPRLIITAGLYLVFLTFIQTVVVIKTLFFGTTRLVEITTIPDDLISLITVILVMVLALRYIKTLIDQNRIAELDYMLWLIRLFLIGSVMNSDLFLTIFQRSSTYISNSSSFSIVNSIPVDWMASLGLIVVVIIAELILEVFLIKTCEYTKTTLPWIRDFTYNPYEYEFPGRDLLIQGINLFENGSQPSMPRYRQVAQRKSQERQSTPIASQPEIQPRIMHQRAVEAPSVQSSTQVTKISPIKTEKDQIQKIKHIGEPSYSIPRILFRKIYSSTIIVLFLYYNLVAAATILFYSVFPRIYGYDYLNFPLYNIATDPQASTLVYDVMMFLLEDYSEIMFLVLLGIAIYSFREIFKPYKEKNDLKRLIKIFTAALEFFVLDVIFHIYYGYDPYYGHDLSILPYSFIVLTTILISFIIMMGKPTLQEYKQAKLYQVMQV